MSTNNLIGGLLVEPPKNPQYLYSNWAHLYGHCYPIQVSRYGGFYLLRTGCLLPTAQLGDDLEAGLKTPPFGLLLFIMRGIAPSGTTIGDTYCAIFPFILCDLIATGVIIAFPQIALWLPSFMTY